MASDFSDSYIQILKDSEAIQFGDFVTKSGRKTPVFINAGHICKGRHIHQLAKLYANVIFETWPQVESLFGPAYKGIPLAVAAAQAMSEIFRLDVTYSFNRKEAKDHGEGGWLIGDQYQKPTNIVIIEDVLTAGTSLRESLKFLSNTPVKVVGIIVGLDREERGISGEGTARAEIEKEFGVRVQRLSSLSALASSPIIEASHRKALADYIASR